MKDFDRLNESANRLRNIAAGYDRLRAERDDESRHFVAVAINAKLPLGWKLGGANVECAWWKHRDGAIVKLLPKSYSGGTFLFWKSGQACRSEGAETTDFAEALRLATAKKSVRKRASKP